MSDIGRPQPGETVVVSAAAGAVGSVAGQIAKRRGARVAGIAGGRDKCALLVERLGFDAAVDRRAGDWRERLAAATPEGIDVDFENAGGEVMDAVSARLNLRARVVLCGLISACNDVAPPPGPRNFRLLLTQRVRLQGFIVLDHPGRRGDAAAELSGWLAAGELQVLQTAADGFEQLPTTINMLFDGTNADKLVAHVADD
jgi:NADPH-dependent curcumin reductase CurA